MSVCKARDVAHVRFVAPDLDKMQAFLEDFGMQCRHKTADALYMRGAGADQFIHVTERGDTAAFKGVAFNVASHDDLLALSKAENVPITDVDDPGGGKRVRLNDLDGVQVDAVWGMEAAAPLPIEDRPDLGFNFAREHTRKGRLQRVGGVSPCKVLRLGHCVMNVTDFRKSEEW
jgi:catechol 2,3-dioxygenase-like lactoylglutathione lyase family enzyme